MCWMQVKQAGKKFNMEHIRKAQEHNGDGYSLTWYEDGKLQSFKTFDFSKLLAMATTMKKHTCLLHLRYATKGAKSYDNIHPFEIPSGYMAHNGTISGFGDYSTSDTQEFATMISECDYKYIEDIEPLIQPFINDKINRMVFFEDSGRITILNKDLGMEEDGIWTSNDYHLKGDDWCRIGCKPKTKKIKDAKMEILTKTRIKTHKVFVYGTLKRGYSNYTRLLKDAVFLGKATTKTKWTMVGEGMAFPYVLEEHSTLGNNVVGEVFAVDSLELKDLDRLEGIPHHYKKREIEIVYNDDKSVEIVTMYIKAHFNGTYIPEMPIINEWKAA